MDYEKLIKCFFRQNHKKWTDQDCDQHYLKVSFKFNWTKKYLYLLNYSLFDNLMVLCTE